jgi:hypothetical protein
MKGKPAMAQSGRRRLRLAALGVAVGLTMPMIATVSAQAATQSEASIARTAQPDHTPWYSYVSTYLSPWACAIAGEIGDWLLWECDLIVVSVPGPGGRHNIDEWELWVFL